MNLNWRFSESSLHDTMNVTRVPYPDDDRWEHLETLVFSKDRNSLCFQARTLYISQSYINMFFLPKWLDLSRFFRVEFDIDHDSPLWSNVLLELLTRDIKISALKLGKLIFKESYVPYLLRYRLTLKILWFQCVDNKYEKWLSNFLLVWILDIYG